MVFYLAGLQNIDLIRLPASTSASPFVHLTIPLLKPTILLTAIMSTSGTLQLFDESVNLTAGGPGKATMTLTLYLQHLVVSSTMRRRCRCLSLLSWQCCLPSR